MPTWLVICGEVESVQAADTPREAAIGALEAETARNAEARLLARVTSAVETGPAGKRAGKPRYFSTQALLLESSLSKYWQLSRKDDDAPST